MIPTTFEEALQIAIKNTAARIMHHVAHDGMTKDQAISYVRDNWTTLGPKSWQKVLEVLA